MTTTVTMTGVGGAGNGATPQGKTTQQSSQASDLNKQSNQAFEDALSEGTVSEYVQESSLFSSGSFAAIGLAGEGSILGGLGAYGDWFVAGMRSAAGGAGLTALLSLSGDSVQDKDRQYTYVTYTRINPKTGQVYAGRTGGYGPPDDIVYRRSLGQMHLTAEGFRSPTIDQISTDRAAIRGREQQLIDFYGGAQSVGGTARNLINGVADFNPNRPYYMNAARKAFGDIPDNSPERYRLDWR
ncbi:hypothetical protein [Rheinheimera soli]|uniref:Uncharacterized protein n=1 Tax=Rheinheimera soli TaxID=443616 RepID=A0ABU1W554_9GAMM|nr:hypothetical protein [Rheinheimera soli]MDR7123088.1 hypothetical protein [Rheinheimera soli]